MASREGGISGRIGEIRSPGAAKRRFPTPKGPSAPGMPGFGEAQATPSVNFDYEKPHIAPHVPAWGGIGAGFPTDMPAAPSAYMPGVTRVPGEWVRTASQAPIPGLPVPQPTAANPELGLSSDWRLQSAANEIAQPRVRQQDAVLSMFLPGGPDSITLRDPALLQGSFKQGRVRRPLGGYPVTLTREDFPGFRPAVNPDVDLDPGDVADVYREYFTTKAGEPPLSESVQGFSAEAALHPGEPGRQWAETFPVDTRTGLPSDVRIDMRGGKGADRAETMAFGGTRAGSIGQDPSTASVQGSRQTAKSATPEMVPIVYHDGGGQFSVKYLDPQQIAENVLIPEGQRKSVHDSDTFQERTVAALVQEALNRAKTPVIKESALSSLERKGRFRRVGENSDGIVGYMRPADSTPRQIVEALQARRGDRSSQAYLTEGGAVRTSQDDYTADWIPVYDTGSENRPSLTTDIQVPVGRWKSVTEQEPLYRIGSPMNRDQEALREGLRDALATVGMGTKTAMVPRPPEEFVVTDGRGQSVSNVRGLGRMLDAMSNGVTFTPTRDGALVETPESLKARVQGMRGQKDHPLAEALLVKRGDEVIDTLLPMRDPTGALTGQYVLAGEEIGPAFLLADSQKRKAAEKWAEKQGYQVALEGGKEYRGGSLEGIAMGLAEGNVFAPEYLRLVPEGDDMLTAMVARGILAPGDLAASPTLEARLSRLAAGRALPAETTARGAPLVRVPREVATYESYARPLLEQRVSTLAGLPLKTVRERLSYDPQEPVQTELPVGSGAGRLGDSTMDDIAAYYERVGAKLGKPFRPNPYAQVALPGFGEAPIQGPRERPLMERLVASSDVSANPAAAALAKRMARRAALVEAGVSPISDTLEQPLGVGGGQLDVNEGQFELPVGSGAGRLSDPLKDALAVLYSREGQKIAAAKEADERWAFGQEIRSKGLQRALADRASARSVQLPLPLQMIGSNQVARSMDDGLVVGRPLGPYGDRSYYGRGEGAAPYQAALSTRGAAGGFSYEDMVRRLGILDSDEYFMLKNSTSELDQVKAAELEALHEQAVHQMTMRSAARNRALAATSGQPSGTVAQPALF